MNLRPINTFNIERLPSVLGKRDPVILEIGAADGRESFTFSKLFPCGKIYCFEPDTRHFESLKSVAELCPNITHIPLGISDKSGEAEFYLSSGRRLDGKPHIYSSSIKPPKNCTKIHRQLEFNETTTIKTIALDEWSEQNKIDAIDFIWADVQGAEKELITGGLKTLKRTKLFYTEYSNAEEYNGQATLDQIMKSLPTFRWINIYRSDVLLINVDCLERKEKC